MAPPRYSDGRQMNTSTDTPVDGGMDYEITATAPVPADMGYEDMGYGYGDSQSDMGYGDAQPDMRYRDAQPNMGYGDSQPDMGYGDARPDTDRSAIAGRRGSMSKLQDQERRASIKAIMADDNLTPVSKRRSIQHLMDGRRSSIATASNHSGSVDESSTTPDMGSTDMGYGDAGNGFNAPAHICYQIEPRCDEKTRHDEQSRPFCTHYQRKCTVVAPCCGAAFGCRICHDECPVLPPPKLEQSKRRPNRSASLPSSFTSMGGPKQIPQDNEHLIDRFAIKEVICRECFTRQSSKTNNCVSCGVEFGEYHCSICNLWMSAEEKPYHCADCGFCRVGGAENFRHCSSCNMCIDRTLFTSHNCKAGKYQSNCPVCQEYLFSSRSASHEMPCGHAIHWDCFRQLAAHDSRCPICKKTAETRERMLPTWTAMAQNIALQPVPAEMARVVNITCNDCEQSSDAQAWHFLGVQCVQCQSFNTIVGQIILSGEEAHEFIEMNEFRRAINEARANGETRTRRRVNRRRSAM